MKKVRKKWTKRCNRNSYTAYFFNVLSNPTLSLLQVFLFVS